MERLKNITKGIFGLILCLLLIYLSISLCIYTALLFITNANEDGCLYDIEEKYEKEYDNEYCYLKVNNTKKRMLEKIKYNGVFYIDFCLKINDKKCVKFDKDRDVLGEEVLIEDFNKTFEKWII